MQLESYIELLEWTGRNGLKGKRGKIPKKLETVLSRFDIDIKKWIRSVNNYGSKFYRIVGITEDIARHAKDVGKKWFWGINGLEKNLLT